MLLTKLLGFQAVGAAVVSSSAYTGYTTGSSNRLAHLPVPAETYPPLLDATLEDLRKGLDTGAFSSLNLVDAYIKRIEEVNPRLRAVTEINPDARTIAKKLDEERKKGGSNLGPLHGIPILVKNTIATADKMNNTAGSFALLGAKVPEDSKVIERLRVETSGSIITPAQVANVVGIKPTVGLTSRYLVIPSSERFDTVGPIARTVKDAAYLLSAIAGKDTKDPYTAAIPFDNVPDYSTACNVSGLKGRRIGVPRHLFKKSGPSISAFESALKTIRDAGAEVVDVTIPGIPELNARAPNVFSRVLGADFKTNLAEYLSHLSSNPHGIKSLEALRFFTIINPKEEHPQRDMASWDWIVRHGLDGKSEAAQQDRYTMMEVACGREPSVSLCLTGVLKEEKLDAIVFPSSEPAAIFSATLVGSPVITVPLGRTPESTPSKLNSYGNLNETGPNTPFGIAFSGAKWSEETLIGMAFAFEQKTQVRKSIKPHVQPQTELANILQTGS
ncbi:hypothetical protein PLICBS_003962 [Purpureocillium lilacinum]|uniref:uncharacterized protein n=1 Tax=Purpureocillium lilacinum TaxID=33203 RepID=UPI00208A2A1C|nr:hypothetical protein PLICBS_003962 [Purpureocillium lilacinum]